MSTQDSTYDIAARIAHRQPLATLEHKVRVIDEG